MGFDESLWLFLGLPAHFLEKIRVEARFLDRFGVEGLSVGENQARGPLLGENGFINLRRQVGVDSFGVEGRLLENVGLKGVAKMGLNLLRQGSW